MSGPATSLRRHHLWWALALTALLWLALIAFALWWLLSHGLLSTALREQAVRLRLPEGLQAQAQVLSPVHADVKVLQHLRVPIAQTVSVSLPQALQAQAQVQTSLPIDTVIRVRQDVPVSATVHARVPVVRWLPAMAVEVPLAFVVPVDLAVPVRVTVPLNLAMDVQVQVPHALPVPIRTALDLRLPVNERLRVDVLRHAGFQWVGQPAPLKLGIAQLPIGQALSAVSWCTTWGCWAAR